MKRSTRYIDWKTNTMENGYIEELHEGRRGQIPVHLLPKCILASKYLHSELTLGL